MRRLIVLLCALVSVFVFAQDAQRFSVDNERIFEVKLTNGYRVHDAILGYQVQSELYLPFEEFGYSLGFSISVFADRGRVEGFLRDESRTFVLDIKRCEFASKNQLTRGEISSDQTCSLGSIFEGDAYVPSSLLEQWLNIKIKAYPLKSLVVVSSAVPTPIEQRQIEDRDRIMALGRRESESEFEKKNGDDTVASWSGPYVDLGAAYDSTGSRSLGGFAGLNYRGFESAFRYSLQKTAPLDLKYTLSKRDSQVLNWRGASIRQLYLYDIFLPGIEGLSASRPARGIYFSNRPSDFSGGNTAKGLRGTGEPGWNVELYSGSVLIAATEVNALGEYEFPNVALSAGDNVFRILLLGPQGQRRQEFRSFGVSDLNPGKGKFQYFLYAANTMSGAESALESHYGISENLAWTSGILVRGASAVGVPRVSLSQGLDSYFDIVSPSILLATDSDSGSFIKPKLRFLFSEASIDLGYTVQNNFFNDTFGAQSQRRSMQSADIVAATVVSWPWPVGARLTAQWEREDGQLDWQQVSEFSASTYAFGLQMQNRIKLTRSNSLTITGTWQVQKLFSLLQLRLSGDYRGNRTESLISDLIWGGGHRQWTFRGSARHSFVEQGNSFSVAFGKIFSRFELGVQATHSRSSGWAGSVGISTSFGRDSQNSRWHSHSEPMTDRSAIVIQTFVDDNDNRVFDAGEAPLANVKFKFNRGTQEFSSDALGSVYLPGLTPYGTQRVSVDSANIVERNLSPGKDEYVVYTEPLKTHRLLVPFTYATDIEGTLRVSSGSEFVTKNYVVILKNVETGAIRKTKTEFDGYYLFDDVKPANYEISIESRESSLVITPEKRILTINSDGEAVASVDFEAKQKPPSRHSP